MQPLLFGLLLAATPPAPAVGSADPAGTITSFSLELEAMLAQANCRIAYSADAPGKTQAAIKHRDEVLSTPENLARMRGALERVQAITGDPRPAPTVGSPLEVADATRERLEGQAYDVCWALEPEPAEGWTLEQSILKLQHKCVTERGRLMQGYAQLLAAVSTAPGYGASCSFPESANELLRKVEDAYLQDSRPRNPR